MCTYTKDICSHYLSLYLQIITLHVLSRAAPFLQLLHLLLLFLLLLFTLLKHVNSAQLLTFNTFRLEQGLIFSSKFILLPVSKIAASHKLQKWVFSFWLLFRLAVFPSFPLFFWRGEGSPCLPPPPPPPPPCCCCGRWGRVTLSSLFRLFSFILQLCASVKIFNDWFKYSAVILTKPIRAVSNQVWNFDDLSLFLCCCQTFQHISSLSLPPNKHSSNTSVFLCTCPLPLLSLCSHLHPPPPLPPVSSCPHLFPLLLPPLLFLLYFLSHLLLLGKPLCNFLCLLLLLARCSLRWGQQWLWTWDRLWGHR